MNCDDYSALAELNKQAEQVRLTLWSLKLKCPKQAKELMQAVMLTEVIEKIAKDALK